MDEKVVKSEQDWREQLSPQQYHVLREKGTERAFTGAYWDEHAPGLYRCAGCGAELFDSATKYESGTGWPSFWAPIRDGAVELHEDRTFGMRRVEVTCARCGSHLGHVFDDGPQPTGERYCMNSCSLDLEPSADATAG
jgi:peptide-methionine (R)-S-oxide reductase